MSPVRPKAFLELIATVAVVALLAAMSRPLAQAPSLDQRYLNGPPHIVRAGALQSDVVSTIAVVAGTGFAVLVAGRSRLPAVAFVSVAAAWTLAAGRTPALDIDRRLADPAVLALLLIACSAVRRGRGRSGCGPAFAWRYPGWVLFTGVGVLWLVDDFEGQPTIADLIEQVREIPRQGGRGDGAGRHVRLQAAGALII